MEKAHFSQCILDFRSIESFLSKLRKSKLYNECVVSVSVMSRACIMPIALETIENIQ